MVYDSWGSIKYLTITQAAGVSKKFTSILFFWGDGRLVCQGSHHQGKSGKVREKFIFLESQGKSGNLSCFLRIRENQGIIFVIGEWSGKVREFSSDSGQLTV